MAKRSKKYQEAAALIEKGKAYPIDEAVALVKKTSKVNFDASVDVVFKLGLDTRHADQQLRGAVVLPHGTGKTKKVLVVTQGAKVEEAKAAGADVVGPLDLLEEGSVQCVDKGGAGQLVRQPRHQPGAHRDAAIDGVLFQVGVQAVQRKQHRAKGQDHPHQRFQRGVGLHLLQHRWGKQQLGDGPARRGHRDAHAQKRHAFVAAPGVAQHERGVLPHVVGWFFGWIHTNAHLFAITIPQQKVPGTFRGRIAVFGGRTAKPGGVRRIGPYAGQPPPKPPLQGEVDAPQGADGGVHCRFAAKISCKARQALALPP